MDQTPFAKLTFTAMWNDAQQSFSGEDQLVYILDVTTKMRNRGYYRDT
jgi:hypothetical protein